MKERNASSELIEIDLKLKEIAPLGTALAQRKHQISEEIRNLKYEINGNGEMTNISHTILEFNFEIFAAEYQSKVKNIEDVDKNRLNLLRDDHGLRSTYQAVLWLRDNKNKFRAPIHEPPLISVRLYKHISDIRCGMSFLNVVILWLQLSVKNTKMAKYVENSIGFNDMKAFFCENKDDSNYLFKFKFFLFTFMLTIWEFSVIVNDLMKILREERQLAVNVVHSPRSDEPSTSEFQPRMALSDLKLV